jgi:hypothetical protein
LTIGVWLGCNLCCVKGCHMCLLSLSARFIIIDQVVV